MANSTIVCDEKVYQSGRNIRQLLVDKRYAKQAESINTRIIELAYGNGLEIPSCDFFHFHSNKPVNLTANDLLQLKCSAFTTDASFEKITLTALEDCQVYVVFNAV